MSTSHIPGNVLAVGLAALAFVFGCSDTSRAPDDALTIPDSRDDADVPEDALHEDMHGESDADMVEVLPDAIPRVDVSLERYDADSCGDWEIAPRTAPATVPEGVSGLSEKWRYNPDDNPELLSRSPGVRCCILTGTLAERPDGDICMVMGGFDSVGCISREGRGEWASHMGRDIEVIGGPLVTPDGDVVVVGTNGVVRAVHGDGPDDATIAWETAVDGVPAGTLPHPARLNMVAIEGGYLVVPGVPSRDSLYLIDRCGQRRWRIRTGTIFSSPSAGVGAETIGVLKDGAEWLTYALSTDGRLTFPAEIPTGSVDAPARESAIRYALGGNRYAAATGGRGETYRWWTAERGGAAHAVELAGSVRTPRGWGDYFALTPDGTVVVVNAVPRPDGFVDPYLRAYQPDGTLRWSRHLGWRMHIDHYSNPLVGRDGRVVMLANRACIDPSCHAEWTGVVMVFAAADGAEETRLELPGVAPIGTSFGRPLLSADGVVYFLAHDAGADPPASSVLVAVQTTVPGLLPEDPGTAGLGRTARRDGWSW